MSITMGIEGIKEGSGGAFHTALQITSDWMNHSVRWIKAGSDVVSPYFQNKVIAGISVFAVTLVSIQIGRMIGKGVERLLPKGSSTKDWIASSIEISLGVGTIAGGVYAFSSFTKLPLNAAHTVAIALSAVILRTAI